MEGGRNGVGWLRNRPSDVMIQDRVQVIFKFHCENIIDYRIKRLKQLITLKENKLNIYCTACTHAPSGLKKLVLNE